MTLNQNEGTIRVFCSDKRRKTLTGLDVGNDIAYVPHPGSRWHARNEIACCIEH